MTFELLPIIDIMVDLYQQPRTPERFQAYLKILHGNTNGDLVLPIGGFNPMAKEHALEKLAELKTLDAEQIIKDTLIKMNGRFFEEKAPPVFRVALNLSDDLKDGWTNRFTADYDSKFKINALFKRNFCIPIFWTSENLNATKIIERTLEYCNRTIYWLSHPNPKTLEAHILQEAMVAKEAKIAMIDNFDIESLETFYKANKDSTDYVTIFNFIYGDAAAALLGNRPLEIKEEFAGFGFANWLANH